MSEQTIDPQDAIGLLRSFTAHRAYLAEAMGLLVADIQRRATVHDLSKLKEDEFAGFSRINAAARINKFGSPEYIAGMKQEKGTINLHFSRNRHHPERPKLIGEAAETARGLPDDCTYWSAHADATMTFLDVIEMVCDWWAARKGYDDPRPWLESVELNFQAKGKHLNDHQLWLARDVAAFLGRWTDEAQDGTTTPACPTEATQKEPAVGEDGTDDWTGRLQHIIRLERHALDNRPLCPDCRDKTKAGDECLRCRYQRAEAKLREVEQERDRLREALLAYRQGEHRLCVCKVRYDNRCEKCKVADAALAPAPAGTKE